MESPKTYLRDSAIKNLDLSLSLEIPLAPSGSCSSCPDISLMLDGMALPISKPEPSISPPSPSDLEGTSSSHWPGTIGDPVP